MESTCACVLGPWPWPRAFLSLASRGSVLGKAVLGLGLGFFWCPWPRALCPRLHLWYIFRCFNLLLIYYLLKSKSYVLRLIAYELTKLVPCVRSARRGALCEAENLPLILSEAIKLKNRLIARVGKEFQKSPENFPKQDEKRFFFFVQNCLSVVRKCRKALFKSARKRCSKVPESVVRKCPEVLFKSARKCCSKVPGSVVQKCPEVLFENVQNLQKKLRKRRYRLLIFFVYHFVAYLRVKCYLNIYL